MEQLRTDIHKLLKGSTIQAGIAIESEGGSILINSNKVFPAASLIKLAILLEGFRQIEEGNLAINETIAISPEMKAGGSGVITMLKQGSYPVIDLMSLMITVSENTAANVLIDRLSMDAVNRMAQRAGCKHTRLQRKMMDFAAIQEGRNNVTTAEDVLQLLKAIHQRKGTFINGLSMMDILKGQQFRHKLPALLDESFFEMANKTGELQGAEHDSIIMTCKRHTLYAAILLNHVSDVTKAWNILAEVGKLCGNYLTQIDKEQNGHD